VTPFSQQPPRAADMSSAPNGELNVMCIVDPDCRNVLAA
jgi:hypothetical protein